MTTNRRMLLTLLAGALGLGGCSTYHYYDIQVERGSVSIEQVGVLQLCHLDVTGADSHSVDLPSSLNGDTKHTICPPPSSSTVMGTFEFATFEDSGSLTFTVTGFKDSFPSSDNLCTSGTLTLKASSQITTMGTLKLDSFDDTKCPNNVVHP
jgi:hypothetical protein